MTAAKAPTLVSEEVQFTALPDGSLLVNGDENAASVQVLADAVERSLSPPYRARAVRRSSTLWIVGAVSTEVVEVREDVAGDDVELVMQDGTRTLTVDGERIFGSVPSLERYAGQRFDSYVARASRLAETLWEVSVLPL